MSNYLDIITAAENEKEHGIILKPMLQRASEAGIKFNVKQMQLTVKFVKCVGHIFFRRKNVSRNY